MTRQHFLDAARAAQIRSDAFSFVTPANECYVLTAGRGGWNIYYSERGLETGLRHFGTEALALGYLLDRLISDRSAATACQDAGTSREP
jgi:hypothetical protein